MTETIEAVAQSIDVGSKSILGSNFIVSFLLAGSLNQLWGMINNLQMLILSALINVQFAGNTSLMFDQMIPIATFDFLPTDDIYGLIFTKLPDRDPFNDKFDRLGFESLYIVFTLGTAFLFLMW